MSTQYDPNILQQFADSLYSQAKWLVFMTASRYGLGTYLIFLVGLIAIGNIHPPVEMNTVWGLPVIPALIGTALGISVGRSKAFNLKLKAQQILCQVQIEQNTRKQEKSLAATQN